MYVRSVSLYKAKSLRPIFYQSSNKSESDQVNVPMTDLIFMSLKDYCANRVYKYVHGMCNSPLQSL